MTISYLDELNQGAEAKVSETARIRFTKDREAADRSVRAEVVTQKELLFTAVAKDQALADADAGLFPLTIRPHTRGYGSSKFGGRAPSPPDHNKRHAHSG